MKKVLFCIIVISLLLLSFMMVYALDSNPEIYVDTISDIEQREDATINISLKNNPGITSMRLEISFDDDLELLSVEYNENLKGYTVIPSMSQKPIIINWILGVNNDDFDGVFVTLKFHVSNDAQVRNHEINVEYNEEDVFKTTLLENNQIINENVHFDITNGGINVIAHTHKFSQWTFESDNVHYRECECGFIEREEHSWDEGNVIIEPTHLSEGKMKYSCTLCNGNKEEKINKTQDHTFSPWTSDGDENHIRICACGQKETEKHVYDDGTITKNASETEEGIKTYSCIKCAQTKSEKIHKAPSLVSAQTKWAKGTNDSIIIKTNGYIEDFEDIMIDGNIVKKDNYEIKDDSVHITLKPSYLSSLSLGNHTLLIKSKSGDVSSTIEIIEKQKETTDVSNNRRLSTPTLVIIIIISSMFVIGMVIIIILISKNKRKKNEGEKS